MIITQYRHSPVNGYLITTSYCAQKCAIANQQNLDLTKRKGYIKAKDDCVFFLFKNVI